MIGGERARQVGAGVILALSGATAVASVVGVGEVATATAEELAGGVSAVFWALLVWAGTAHLLRRDTAGRDVLVAAAWVVGVAANYGLLMGIIVEQQQAAGVAIEEPFLVVNGVVGVGAVHGLLVGYLHVRTREQRRTLESQRSDLRERTEDLEVLNRLLRHDIRNDVTVIQGYAEQLAERDVSGVEPIRRKADHILELTAMAGDVNSSLEAAEGTAVDVGDVLDAVVDQMRSAYPEAVIEVEGDLPHGTAVTATPLVSSVFENLVRNAVQHNDADTPRVTVSTSVDTDAVTVRVADNGPGVPEAMRERLFQPGEKGGESAGMGIGLYLVDTLVDEYGGEAWVEQREGESGAVFGVSLPRAERDVETTVAATVAGAAGD